MEDTKRSVAVNVRRIRTGRGLSISELSRQSGVAKRTLIQLEGARGNPTLGTLMTLATHLGVPLTELIADDHVPRVHVTKADEGVIVRGDGVQLRLVHRSTAGDAMYEIFDMTVTKGAYASPAHANGVTEHVMVHSGELRVGPEDSPVNLRSGDFASFAADVPHVYAGTRPTSRATLTVVYPVGAPSALPTPSPGMAVGSPQS